MQTESGRTQGIKYSATFVNKKQIIHIDKKVWFFGIFDGENNHEGFLQKLESLQNIYQYIENNESECPESFLVLSGEGKYRMVIHILYWSILF